MTDKTTLIKKLTDKTAKIGILGMGYVGMPLAVVFAEAGFAVTGIDPDKRKLETFNKGISYIQDVPSETVTRLHKKGLLNMTADFAAIKEMDAISICVPTPLRKTGDPDMSFIMSAGEELAKYIHKGMVIVLESTTYPGTTRELLAPMLTEKSGLVVGEDIFICFSPERVDPGREDWTTYNTPKVLGGITPACGEVAKTWYEGAIKTIVSVSTVEAAEMTKLLENTFRMINIGMVNELAMMCERLGVDVWEVIEAAGTKPFGFMKFTPGPGLGGHCIPIDPLYLSWKMKELNYTAKFIGLASEINTNMPRYVVSRLMEGLNDRNILMRGSKVLVLGVAYKPDIDDVRESPAIDVIALMEQKGVNVQYYDPYIPSYLTHDGIRMEGLKSKAEMINAAENADAVVIITNHSDFEYETIVKQSKFIFDTRNALGSLGQANEKVMRL